ncbi:endonuclease/exonuclease/phosphatase family protein [Luteimonas sp. M1R5S18]|jgi:endonuclease/exonuclease/phosphatase family metal-dependent hydrolase|uniref:Endonuclease/exonuclease/phosphatase family protein n=1 Tax=Luteimonas rhizosphaericola TaxID=3042024 RepID=A0ABT6JLC6_9GAMM|nr:endonuclease/exonuclease/phosphatase family protein [Luteimonas rhizosphaericola]MDH5831488.1 endonuclease/exonuclease/phosphatase family protein [Luteimonas rhizosphaericola]
MSTQHLRLLSANIQAGSSTRRYSDYATRSWSHVLPTGGKRTSLDAIAQLAGQHDIVGLQESDPGSWRSGFTNQTHYLAERAGFDYWSHQPNRRMGAVASSANGLLSRLEPVEVADHALPGRISGRGVLLGHFGNGPEGLTVAVAHLSLGAQSRRMQLDFIAELLQDFPNAVLMGDFNCVVDCPEMGNLFRRTRLQPPACAVHTFPAWKPMRAIDHILVSDSLRCEGLRAVPAAFSDHLALSLNLEVPESALQR